jgi:hypothetical protein
MSSSAAAKRRWALHLYDAKWVVGRATAMPAGQAEDVPQGPRARLGPPWTKDHRTALAATVVCR